ncbi:MAG: ParB/RepB/Spo0J family partition protein [Gammaproteobacteria bacterium]|nr:ParB/RepB/Spo0J family partition protein [Gammaproteobacteria bacterium]
MKDSKKLGKGLEALLRQATTENMEGLLDRAADAEVDETTVSDNVSSGELKTIPVDLIQRGKYQPRAAMHQESLEELAASIRTQGIIQPIVVRSVAAGKFEIIAGERRWRAVQLAGLQEIPALVKQVDNETAIAMALIENIQREDLGALEEAVALKRLQDEFSLTQQQVADAVGKSRATVANLMRLVHLHPEVRSMLEKGELDMGHARALLSLPDSIQPQIAREVLKRNLTVRQTEKLVRRELSGNNGIGNEDKKVTDPDIKNLENGLAEKLGARVLIQHTAQGKGKLVVNYNSLDELDGILAHIN